MRIQQDIRFRCKIGTIRAEARFVFLIEYLVSISSIFEFTPIKSTLNG